MDRRPSRPILSLRIKAALEAKDLTLYNPSDCVEFTKATVIKNAFEETMDLNARKLRDLAENLNVSPSWLIFGAPQNDYENFLQEIVEAYIGIYIICIGKDFSSKSLKGGRR